MTRKDDWHAVALDKLTRVLGPSTGQQTMLDVLQAMGTTRLESSADMRRFAETLAARGGFAGAVGALLSVHATMYGTHAERV
jgi:hypothetical protein